MPRVEARAGAQVGHVDEGGAGALGRQALRHVLADAAPPPPPEAEDAEAAAGGGGFDHPAGIQGQRRARRQRGPRGLERLRGQPQRQPGGQVQHPGVTAGEHQHRRQV